MRRNYAFYPLIKIRGICNISSSSSKPQNTTATTTNTQETNLYDTGTGNLDVANSSGVTITETCEGSIADAAALGQSAIQENSNVALHAICGSDSVATDALDALTNTQQGSATLVEDAITALSCESKQAAAAENNAATIASSAASSSANLAATSTSSTAAALTTTKYVLLAIVGVAAVALIAYAYTHRSR